MKCPPEINFAQPPTWPDLFLAQLGAGLRLLVSSDGEWRGVGGNGGDASGPQVEQSI